MKTFVKLTFVIATALTFSKADAAWHKDQKKTQTYETTKIGKGPGHGKEEHEMTAGYSKAARWNPTGSWDFFVSGSFLYWHVSEECLDIAQFTTSDSPQKRGAIVQRFKYKPGFKVAIGTNFGHDNWTGKAEYTRLHMSTRISSEVPPGANSALAIATWWQPNTIDGTNVFRVKSFWKNDLDVLDGELARSYYSGKMLILRPFIGPRAAWIDQEFDASFSNAQQPSTFFTARWKSTSWSIGPRAGLDMNWELGYGFRLTGSAAGSLLYKRQRVRARSPSATDASVIATTMRFSYRFIRPNAELGMGIGWGSYYWDKWGHFDLMAAYEFHYWWNENVMRQSADMLDTFACAKPGDLMYHGLTLTMRFDF